MLSETQRRILRDMAGGAKLEWRTPDFHATCAGVETTLLFREVMALQRDNLITPAALPILNTHHTTYTLTPAGAEAAREGE